MVNLERNRRKSCYRNNQIFSIPTNYRRATIIWDDWHQSPRRCREQEQAKKSSNAIKVPIFIHIAKENRAFTLEAEVGQSFYELTQEYPEELGPYLECACRGIAACSTCHVYIGSGGDNNGSDQSEKDFLSKLPPPEENELDMLDLAWGYHPKTSRLGCQIKINESLRGLTVTIPEGVNNLYS